MDIRKLSIGADFKNNAMHYIVGQEVLGGYKIHLIKKDIESESIKIWIEQGDEIFLWKEFSSTMPIAIEFNINF